MCQDAGEATCALTLAEPIPFAVDSVIGLVPPVLQAPLSPDLTYSLRRPGGHHEDHWHLAR